MSHQLVLLCSGRARCALRPKPKRNDTIYVRRIYLFNLNLFVRLIGSELRRNHRTLFLVRNYGCLRNRCVAVRGKYFSFTLLLLAASNLRDAHSPRASCRSFGEANRIGQKWWQLRFERTAAALSINNYFIFERQRREDIQLTSCNFAFM